MVLTVNLKKEGFFKVYIKNNIRNKDTVCCCLQVKLITKDIKELLTGKSIIQ